MRSVLEVFYLVAICSVIFSVRCSEFYVVKHPTYLKFDPNTKDSLKASDFLDLVLSINGFSTHRFKWTGMRTLKPLEAPKVTLLFLTEQQPNLETFGAKLNIIDDEPVNLQILDDVYEDHFQSKDLVKHFDNYPNPERKFWGLKEKCKHSKSLVYTIKFTDEEDIATMIKEMDRIMTKFYQDCMSTNDLIVYLLTASGNRERRANTQINEKQVSADDAKKEKEKSISGVAEFYSVNYPVAFHLIFWMSLFLFAFVFSVSYLLWNMNPGTDTIIYKMTKERRMVKKYL